MTDYYKERLACSHCGRPIIIYLGNNSGSPPWIAGITCEQCYNKDSALISDEVLEETRRKERSQIDALQRSLKRYIETV